MDDRPFRFRHVHKISVGFVCLAFVLVVGAVVYTGMVQRWMEETTYYRVVLPKDGTAGLEVGAQVSILGKKVGTVERIELCLMDGVTQVKPSDDVSPDEIQLVAVASVGGEYTRFIGSESQALLKRDLGGLGASYLDISRGATPRAEDGGLLEFAQEKGMQDEATRVIGLVEDKLVPLLDSVKDTSDSANDLIKTLNSEDGNLQKTLASLRSTLDKASEGDGAVSMLLNDQKFRDDMSSLLADLSGSIEKLNDTLETVQDDTLPGVNDALAGVPETMESVQSLSKKFEGVADDISGDVSDLSHEFQKLAVALQGLPLVRNYVPDDEEGEGAEKPKADGNPGRTGLGGTRKVPVGRRNR